MRIRAARETKYGKRHVPGVMNKTESAYSETLELRRMAGEILSWKFEAVTLKLADDTRYTPDFFVVLSDGTAELVDVKGGGPVDAKSLVKIKVSAQEFPMFAFYMEIAIPRREGGDFRRQEF